MAESPQPRPAPAYVRADNQVDKLQTSINTGVVYQRELEERVQKEGALHDNLHKLMVESERSTVAAVSKVTRRDAGVQVAFRPGNGRKPKLKFKGKPSNSSAQLDKAIEDAKFEFSEYKQKWQSHKESDQRLAQAAKNLKEHEARVDRTAKSLQSAQNSLVKATDAEAKKAEKEAKAKTPGYFAHKRLVEKEKNETRREQIESRKELREAKEDSRAQRLEAKEKRRKEMENKRAEKTMGGISTLRRPQPVRVRQHHRRLR
jgi:hypothetical protein